MAKIPFVKMSGSGNDFIIIDNRDRRVDVKDLSGFAQKVCRRRLSAGADGLILIETSATADFKWQFYNSDGSRAEMCGNGARCAARFAFLDGIAGPTMSFETIAGRVAAEVDRDRVKIKMTNPVDMKIDYPIELDQGSLHVSSVNTGVPHVVVVSDKIEDVDVVKVGKEIRRHDAFAPAGTNVNFIWPGNQGQVLIRTYERGVEDETLACGTGAVAAALVVAANLGNKSPVQVKTRSGGVLTVYFSETGGHFSDVYLEGDARLIYRGELWDDAWN
ncbi:MAG: diaminopimelate epimerase [Desulfobacterales bacterium]|nr:diaminopimelate epimerase [Desulfobacterales bacterium]